MKILPTPKHFLIIAGGDLDAGIVCYYAPNRTIVALDAAGERCYSYNVIPHIILGDFDSLQACNTDYFHRKAALAYFDQRPLPSTALPQFECYKIPDGTGASVMYVRAHHQDYADLEKGVQFCLAQQENDESITITIIGAFGGNRVDLALHNFSVLKQYATPHVAMRMVNAHQEVVFLADEQVTFGGRPGDTLGLFGFPSAHASSRGLKWELNHFPLIMGERSSACNALLDDVVTIDVKGQALMIKANKDFTHLNGEK